VCYKFGTRATESEASSMTYIALVAFDDFTDIDIHLAWDLLNRAEVPDWTVEIVGSARSHRSATGLELEPHAGLDACRRADAVLFGSGRGSRECIASREFLGSFSLDPQRQLIGSQCSGALILAALGLLEGMPATTHPRARAELEALGVRVIDAPLVVRGNVATAGGCLAAVYLASWVLERLAGQEQRDAVLRSVAPVAQGGELLGSVSEILSAATKSTVD